MKVKDLINLSWFPYDEIRIGVKGLDEFYALYSYDGSDEDISPALLSKDVLSYAVKVFSKNITMCEISLLYVLFIQIDY